ncbi:MAG TPA: hypothetical protein VF054_19455 [Micromonosporaceae bacterium]
MSTQVPTLLRGLVDDAAVFPPGSAPLPEAVAAHRRHRTAWYRDLIGPLLLPASALRAVPHLLGAQERLAIAVIADAGVALEPTLDALDDRLEVRQVEVAVAKRGEDPQPGLRTLLDLLTARPHLRGYAEIPLAWGLMSALDEVERARRDGIAIAAKFRTGGLAAELFPSPDELAAVICACRDRELPFKLTAGLHHAVRYTDRHTGFTHHGFLNILVAAGQAADGAPVAEVARTLSTTEPAPLAEAARTRLDQPRPLWLGYGTCSISEPLDDLAGLGLLQEDAS